mmetsp:Transcript_47207/g.100747  ORF Transcript_47207/g.100747 Transcript_47207/m.100747 type:complete len:259 (-) Transcript_47207:309-1085(-)
MHSIDRLSCIFVREQPGTDGSFACTMLQAEAVVPAESEPSRGYIVVSLEMAATSAVATQSGARGGGAVARLDREQAASLELLQRTASGELVDPEALCIEQGRAVWCCRCDVYVLEHDGNVLDAAMLAMVCALQDVRLPRVRLDDADKAGSVRLLLEQERAIPLLISRPLYSISFGVVSTYLLLDPTADEEALSTTVFSLILGADGAFASLHKPGGAPVDESSIASALDAARSRLPALVAVVRSCERPEAAAQPEDGLA